jgi:hypothetical protein
MKKKRSRIMQSKNQKIQYGRPSFCRGDVDWKAISSKNPSLALFLARFV